MCDILNGITQAMCIVISRVNAPLSTSTMMGSHLDAISYWIHFPIAQCHFHT
ncbi:unnamed protein product [Schistosoma curassoni]|uniref:Uncharacterized protein n=1 Tax=Schistosoma curassoni TaxID=6186 RepID=A0A183KVT0_9TREM|nr:unnamed protein product [Schistosoma curassoni]